MEYREIERSLSIPRGTGRDGFLRVIGDILKLPKVQEISIQANGKVKYRQFVHKDSQDNEHVLNVDLETLKPYFVLRNCRIRELHLPEDILAPVAISMLFAEASREGMAPVAFVSSPDTRFWEWHGRTSGVVFGKEEAYGLPVYTDEELPDEVFFLCASYSREARLIDTKSAYKLSIPNATRSGK